MLVVSVGVTSVLGVACRRSIRVLLPWVRGCDVDGEPVEFSSVEPDASTAGADVEFDAGMEGDVENGVETEWAVHVSGYVRFGW